MSDCANKVSQSVSLWEDCCNIR